MFIELVNFLGISGWRIDLDYCDIEWFVLEMNQDHSVVFEISVGTGLEKISFHSNPSEW